MPRIEFDGQGTPIPQIALPPFGGDSDMPPTVLTFTEDTNFSVADYRSLGFTHFEVWCVGAAGGKGGDTASLIYGIEEVMRPVPQDIWNLELELAAFRDYWQQSQDYNSIYYSDPNFYNPAAWPPGYVHSPNAAPPGNYPPPLLNRVYTGGDTAFTGAYPYTIPVDGTMWRWMSIMQEFGLSSGGGISPPFSYATDFNYVQMFEYNNQVHQLFFRTYRQAALNPSSGGIGGAGGGGGMHKTAGALADLPDMISISVGKAGEDAVPGQVIQLGPYTATYTPQIYDTSSSLHPYRLRENQIYNFYQTYLTTYPLPHPSFDNPQAGQDGGASTFAGILCQASGGKGGGPGAVWDGSKFVNKGDGGAGGVGGRSVAGGGGGGSIVAGTNGFDGVWRPETGIGEGGGGGKASGSKVGPLDMYGHPTFIPVLPSAGGQGSYSYADTSVYGQRQFRQPWSYMQVTSAPPVLSGGRYLATGQLVFTPVTKPDQLIIPGGGGGARPLTNLKVGSRAPGYSPNGIVALRLTQIKP